MVTFTDIIRYVCFVGIYLRINPQIYLHLIMTEDTFKWWGGSINDLSEKQVEELINFNHVETDLADLIDDQPKFDMEAYLNGTIDY